MNSCGGLTPPHEVGAQSDGVTPGLPAVMIIISKSLSQTRQTRERCIFRLKQRLRYHGQLAPPPPPLRKNSLFWQKTLRAHISLDDTVHISYLDQNNLNIP